jgi:hypothetical protein
MRNLFAAFMRARQAQADRAVLEQLDARTLRDVGLEAWNSVLAERLESHRQRQILRLATAHFGRF